MKEVKITSYHFIESGLDNIYLENINADKCENCASASPYFDRVDEIMKNIARAIVLQPTLLSGKDISFLRRERGINLKDWARLLRLNQSELFCYENNERHVDSVFDLLNRLLYVRILEEQESRYISEFGIVNISSISSFLEETIDIYINDNHQIRYGKKRVA